MTKNLNAHTERDGKTVLPIQYLRGVAAIMVVWWHVRVQIPNFEPFLSLKFGAAGVDLFFVISGFIMQITTMNSTIHPLEFMRRRIIRVVPLYWMLTLLMASLWLFIPSSFKTLMVTPQTLVESLLFIPHYSHSFPQNIYPLLIPGWTLNYEIFFYLVFAFSLTLSGSARTKMLAVVMVGLVCIGMYFGPFSSAPLVTYTSPLLLEFLAGVLIGRFWLVSNRGIGLGQGVLLFVLGWVALIVNALLGINDIYLNIIGAILVIAGSINSGFIRYKNKNLQLLGDSTYSIYLTHLFTLGIARAIWVRLAGDAGGYANAVAFALFALVSCVGVGVVSYFLVERPITKYLSRHLVFAKTIQ